MARVTYGSGVTELAGSIGGVTYQKNASGNIAKLRSNPTVNPTILQSAQQQKVAYLVAYWPTLSQANKDLWDAFAIAHDHTTPWGEIKTLSGYQWFMSCNLYRLYSSATAMDSPGGWLNAPPPAQFTLVATVNYLRVEWVPAFDPDRQLAFYLSLPLRQSSLKLRRSLYIVADRGADVPIDDYDLTSEFETLAGVTWADFYNSANCSIICRIIHGYFYLGQFSSFTSAIVKIG